MGSAPVTPRLDYFAAAPQAAGAMRAFEKAVVSSGLEHSLIELVKTRASQINGCAYCIEMHADVAMKHGESPQRLLALAAWRESPLFNEEERLVLALTDEVTLIADQGLSDATYRQGLALLGETLLAQCLMQIITINAWNRVAVATRMEHPKQPG